MAEDQLALVRKLQLLNVEQAEELAALKKGGGGGNSGGMDARVNRLEDRLDKATDRLVGVEVNLATLTERVSHLPSKGFIVKTLATSVALIGGIILAADRLKGLLGL